MVNSFHAAVSCFDLLFILIALSTEIDLCVCVYVLGGLVEALTVFLSLVKLAVVAVWQLHSFVVVFFSSCFIPVCVRSVLYNFGFC